MKSIKIITLFTLILMFTNCEENNDNPIICTQIFVHGLEINVTEKGATNPITGAVKITASDGNYKETLENSDPNMAFYGAGERRGTYILTVTSDNYKTFESEPIIVTADECHVITEKRTFELELK
tara:strand:- start:70 stop:444 length:375 start_codon:yes stop_codon:yes gene_type:complete